MTAGEIRPAPCRAGDRLAEVLGADRQVGAIHRHGDQQLGQSVRGPRHVGHEPGQAVHLGPQDCRGDQALSVGGVVGEAALITGELAVEPSSGSSPARVDEHAAHFGQRVVAGRAVDRPGARQLFARLQDLLDREPGLDGAARSRRR